MAKKQPTSQPLQHTRGGTTTKDATDVGVPMQPAPEGYQHQGPEDAMDPLATDRRGNYADRLGPGQHFTTEAVYSGTPYDNAPVTRVLDQGGPLDAADPDYERLRAQRQGRG